MRILIRTRGALVSICFAVIYFQTINDSRAQGEVPVSTGSAPVADAAEEGHDAAQLEERLTRLLVADGFANVAARVEEGRVVVVYENARYRDPHRALERAAELLLRETGDDRELVLVPTVTAVPLLSVRYAPRDSGGGTREWTPSTGSIELPDLRSDLLRAHRGSSSFGRIDIVVHPWFEARFGNYEHVMVSRTGIAPEFRLALQPGLTASAQVLLTLHDDLPTGESTIRPAVVTVTQTVRLPRNVFIAGSAGMFTRNRYGLDLRMAAYSPNGKWSADAELGLTGESSYARDDWRFSRVNEPTAIVTIAGRIPRYNVTVRTTAGIFLPDERGARLDVARRFGEFELGWFGSVVEHGVNGGITLRLPLPQRRYPLPAPVRIRSAEWFPWQYRYKTFRANARPFETGWSPQLPELWPDYLDSRPEQ